MDAQAVFRVGYRAVPARIKSASSSASGVVGDTSPLGGLLRGTGKLLPGNWLKTETMKGKARREARFALLGGNLLNLCRRVSASVSGK